MHKGPIVYIIDDDDDFKKLITRALDRSDVYSKVFSDPKDFLNEIESSPPDACFIDLNLDKDGMGFILIKAIRSTLGENLPLIVISARKDKASIMEAMNSGADDYLIKPVGRKFLEKKLSCYKNFSIEQDQLNNFYIPHFGASASLELDFEVIDLNESGIKLTSPHFVSYGVTFHIKGVLLESLLREGRNSILVRSEASVLDKKTNEFHTVMKFDRSDKKLQSAIRELLKANALF